MEIKNVKMKSIKFQSGITLITTLIMSVFILVISAGLYYIVESDVVSSSNLALKKGSLHATDVGANEAVQWLNTNKLTLGAHNLASGYYASSPDLPINESSVGQVIDFTGLTTPGTTADDVAWDGGGANFFSARQLTGTVNGYNVSYIIHRLCSSTGQFVASSTMFCKVADGTSNNANATMNEGVEYGHHAISTKAMLVYRITVRAIGPKNSVSYIQTKALIEN